MDLYDAACSLQRAQERYHCWREMRAAVAALPPGSAVPGWIRETASSIQTAADLRDRDQAGIWLRASATEICGDLRRARVEHWYQQGKALRYALVLCRSRLERLAQEFSQAAASTLALNDPAQAYADPNALQLLREQVHVLGVEIAAWQARRRPAERVCSLHDLERVLADPQHAADKERLEDIIGRAHRVGLPPALACVRFRWDTVSGAIERAEVLAVEGLGDLPTTPETTPSPLDADLAA